MAGKMEIPGNDFRIKGKAVQDRIKVGDKSDTSKSIGGTSSTGGAEHIAISSKARDIQKATELINAAPDIRIEKVGLIKEQIENGTYRISSEQLAEKIIENIIKESNFLG
jgi:negative regulator of flagellin synthesis FlgM